MFLDHSEVEMWVRICFVLFSFLFSAAFALAPVHEYQLSNGLKLIVKEDHRSPIVLSSIWYKVGGSYEPNGITGISHVLEHMMFRGTSKYPAGQLDQLISRVGGQQNAMTVNDFTMYYQLLPANQLALSFELEADRMKNLVLSPKDFAKEIQVVMEERRMRFDDNPQALTWERFMAAAHVNNPYHHQAIGWMTDLKNMTDQDVKNWYQTWYQPNNAVIVVVGDVHADQVHQLAERYFGKIPAKTVPHLKPRTEIPPFGVVHVNVNLKAQLPFLVLGYQTPTLATTPQSWQPYALDVLAHILGGSNSARLQNDLVRSQRYLTSVQVDYDPFELHSDLLQIIAIPASGYPLAQIQQAIFQQIIRLQTELVTEDELERVKAQMIAAKIYRQDSIESQALILGGPEMVGLSWQAGENYVNAINQITAAQVQQVAKLFLVTKALTIGVLHPLNNSTGADAHDKTSH